VRSRLHTRKPRSDTASRWCRHAVHRAPAADAVWRRACVTTPLLSAGRREPASCSLSVRPARHARLAVRPDHERTSAARDFLARVEALHTQENVTVVLNLRAWFALFCTIALMGLLLAAVVL
jgi:hypothetical protein